MYQSQPRLVTLLTDILEQRDFPVCKGGFTKKTGCTIVACLASSVWGYNTVKNDRIDLMTHNHVLYKEI